MIRIKDIAEKCGVSTATVSYVIHGKTAKVSQAVREKIEAEIANSGYISNQSALSLVSRSSGLIGVAIMNHSDNKNIMADPYFGVLLSYLEKEFRKQDKYILVLLDQSMDGLIRDARRWNLDGLVLCNQLKEMMVEISSQFLNPIVTIDASFVFEYDKLVQIFIDDYHGGYLMGEYFLSLGHKNVAMLDDSVLEVNRHRWRGFRQAYLDKGIKLLEASHYIIDIDKEKFHDGLTRIFPEIKNHSAIFCVSDNYALQLMNYFSKNGIRIPEDISISGYDDIFYTQFTMPELTTIRQNVEEKAVMAVNSMMDMLAGKHVTHNITLPVELVVRDSCRSLL
ncbi:LacI family DNA-binding transcriptional regulator [Oribacterium sp. WCC10]|uniref:LacI family DNA-binding transcriptional regulator n=1 Tax=Oribacterium sp. WCC10 TaxID=1855343 RepID=UPI0008F25226|nr:LacI family DNA-binding transcriptional regulator [Oribacterium sp. WCC10]SFG51444.1 transcriptional regulator, LacI family [Oribacterium sp. WCC10]